MKVLVMLIIFLFLMGLIIFNYYTDENEVLKRNINKLSGRDCELKQLPNGWTQIENCVLYRIKKW